MAPWLIWIAMAVLAAAAAIPILAPLARGRAAAVSAGAQAAHIYRDQLAEIDRDLAAGTIAGREAEAARTEIARRLIHAGGEADASAAGEGGRAPRIAAVVAIAMPVAAFGLYLILGSPEYPDQPLVARAIPAENADVATLLAAVEARLAAAPDDGAGWDVIAPVYLRLGRSADAVTAYSNAIRLLGASAVRETGLGEAITALAGGRVTPEARTAFERAQAIAPDDPRLAFYLALALQQEGRTEEARAAWQAMLAGAPADAPWLSVVREQLAALDMPDMPGPSQEDVEAAASLPPEDRAAMIEGMVASLAARLEADGSDPAGWARLVRSYMVLGRPDDARAALADARVALAGDGEGLAAVEAAARETGLVEDAE